MLPYSTSIQELLVVKRLLPQVISQWLVCPVCMVKSHLLNPQEIYCYNSECEGLYKYNAHSNSSMFHSVYFFNTIHMC